MTRWLNVWASTVPLAPLLAAVFAAPRWLDGDANGCSALAIQNASGRWAISCSGNSCGSSGTDACEILQGGGVGTVFDYCGCDSANPPTPACCYSAVNIGTNTPFGNGLCYGESPVAEGCYTEPPCNSVTLILPGVEIGACQGPLPEQPHH